MRSPCSCLTKAPPPLMREERNGETWTGGGGFGEREKPSRLFLVIPCCVAFVCCERLCFRVSILACLWPCDAIKHLQTRRTRRVFVKYVSAESVRLLWTETWLICFFFFVWSSHCLRKYCSGPSTPFSREIGKWKRDREEKRKTSANVEGSQVSKYS